MPHITLEISNNVKENNYPKLLENIHKILVHTLSTELSSCKSRVITHDIFLVGDGIKNNAFAHLNIEVLSGRSKETLELAAQKLKTLLEEHFVKHPELKISIAIKNLPEIYYKN